MCEVFFRTGSGSSSLGMNTNSSRSLDHSMVPNGIPCETLDSVTRSAISNRISLLPEFCSCISLSFSRCLPISASSLMVNSWLLMGYEHPLIFEDDIPKAVAVVSNDRELIRPFHERLSGMSLCIDLLDTFEAFRNAFKVVLCETN